MTFNDVQPKKAKTDRTKNQTTELPDSPFRNQALSASGEKGKPAGSITDDSTKGRAVNPALSLSELRTAHDLMMKSLRECTGLPDLSREIITCWTLATYALPTLQMFPILVLRGAPGTGKSSAESVIEHFGRKSKRMSLAGSTLPTIRDFLADCREGTAVVEEADSAWGDRDNSVESLLNQRYSRRTEDVNLKVQVQQAAKNKNSESPIANVTDVRKLFGATTLHKRESFKDAVLDTKSLTVLFRFNPSRDTDSYREFSPQDPWNAEGRKILSGRTLELPMVNQPARVAARVFNTHRPVLQVAAMLENSDLDDHLIRELHAETSKLNAVQGDDPESLVLNAITQRVFQTDAPDWNPIEVSYLCRTLREERSLEITSYRLGSYAKELGFQVRKSGGRSRIFPKCNDLLRAADRAAFTDDEQINRLREQMKGPQKTVAISEKKREEG
jgi:hypothetical protein